MRLHKARFARLHCATQSRFRPLFAGLRAVFALLAFLRFCVSFLRSFSRSFDRLARRPNDAGNERENAPGILRQMAGKWPAS